MILVAARGQGEMKSVFLKIGALTLGVCLALALAACTEHSFPTASPQTNGHAAVAGPTNNPASLEAGTSTAVTANAVIVNKSERKLRLLRDGAVIATFPVGLGSNPQGDKIQEGDGRTPEGTYVLDGRNLQSHYHLSIHISYPNDADWAQAAARGVSPGGDIFIHGTPWLDYVAGVDWTNGCIAVSNADMDAIWAIVPDGTPITILP
jgi:murein L,D-transpeptidase YafK